jgi:virginiamycin A acetyltransferase
VTPEHHSAPSRAKQVLDAVALILVSPALAAYWLSRRVAPQRGNAAFQGYSQLVSLVPGTFGVFIRRAFYRACIDSPPRNCSIGFGTLFATPAIGIGEGTYIGEYCNIGDVMLGRDVLVGSNVTLLSGRRQHDATLLDVPIRHQGGTYALITIGDDVWLGNGAIVMADVGAHAIVAAGAVVVKPVAPYHVVAGNPASTIGTRDGSAHPTDGVSASDTADNASRAGYVSH